MGQGAPPGLIWWVGSGSDLASRLLASGSHAEVVNLEVPWLASGLGVLEQAAGLRELMENRPRGCLGIALPPGVAALRAAAAADGLARAVGWADSLAFAGGLPGGFAFLARVGGMVAALREAVGQQYLPWAAHVETQGPMAWAALAALTQLRVTGMSAIPDAMTGAVAHRLGVELGRAEASVPSVDAGADGRHAPIRFVPGGFAVTLGEDAVTLGEDAVLAPGGERRVMVTEDVIELHTVAAQIRLFTSREPDVARMRRELISES